MFNMTNYDDVKASFTLETPALYNFAFDVIDKRAQEADKLAYIEVDSTGENIRYYQFSDLSKRSNQFANGLLSLGAKKGDLAFVMIPRVGEWYSVMLCCCKLGVVTMPATNLLTSQDIEYRINRSKASMAIVSANNADKVEAIKKNCPSLKTLIVIGEPKEGWCTFESLTQPASTHLDRSQLAPSKASDLMMIYFTSGTTGMPKMVPEITPMHTPIRLRVNIGWISKKMISIGRCLTRVGLKQPGECCIHHGKWGLQWCGF